MIMTNLGIALFVVMLQHMYVSWVYKRILYSFFYRPVDKSDCCKKLQETVSYLLDAALKQGPDEKGKIPFPLKGKDQLWSCDCIVKENVVESIRKG